MPDKHFGSNAGKVTVKGNRASRSQRDILGRALAYADKVNAPYAAKKALIEAIIVESEATNLKTPSADGYGSYGVLQGFRSMYPMRKLLNPEFNFGVFLGTARNTDGRKTGWTGKGGAIDLAKKGNMKSGDIAQTVEGSAYPERYGQVGREAAKIIKLYQGSKGSGRVDPVSGGKAAPVAAAASGGTDANLITLFDYAKNFSKGKSITDLADALATSSTTTDAVDTTPTVTTKAPKSGGMKAPSSGGGKGSKIKELFYDPQGGWKGTTSIGPIGNHSDHVHVAAGEKTVVRLGKTAQKMGLRVSENKAFDTVDPVHTANSWHYKNRAIDVSGDPKKMAAFARYVRRRYGLK